MLVLVVHGLPKGDLVLNDKSLPAGSQVILITTYFVKAETVHKAQLYVVCTLSGKVSFTLPSLLLNTNLKQG